jgi:hypothetical protein
LGAGATAAVYTGGAAIALGVGYFGTLALIEGTWLEGGLGVWSMTSPILSPQRPLK